MLLILLLAADQAVLILISEIILRGAAPHLPHSFSFFFCFFAEHFFLLEDSIGTLTSRVGRLPLLIP